MFIWPISWSASTQATDNFLVAARALFICTALYAGALLWIAPHPPLTDLPQQAGQVALLHELIGHTSPWQAVVRTNFLTPYLIGYGLALPLTYIMPVAAALKLVLTIAYYAFVFFCTLLRKRFGADERLDWLFIPSFFGYAFSWGFYTYLVAAPLGLLFILIVHGYAAAPTFRKGTAVLLTAVALFFSHALVFLFACGIGVGIIAIRQKQLARFLPAMLPFVPLAIICVVYVIVSKERDPLLALETFAPTGWYWNRARVYSFLLFSWFTERRDIIFVLASLAMLAAPWLMRDRINRRDPSVAVPLAAVVFVWLAVPSVAMKTFLLYERFALYLLPAYALIFTAPGASSRKDSRGRDALIQLMMMAICWAFLGLQTVRMHRFAVESAPFETLLSLAEPGQRALGLVFDANSAAFDTRNAYRHFPVWYQAERHGFVDFNFAWFLPQIVRFKPDQLPAVQPGFDDTFEFDWKKHNGRQYRYFFVRNTQPLPAGFVDNGECDVALVRKVEDWSLYERRACR
ncbi:hypothetical protein WN982_16835 [Paraburkholderia sp. IMGN_8]|uniref:hypothetical protein n=1 Tax=Paraburkholderia sp. IMGN_8 TaxID=3136564 RepID=UPI0031015F49